MSVLGDDDNEMRRNLDREDRDFESLLRGHVRADRPDLEAMAAFVQDLRAVASTPATPNAALAELLSTGFPAHLPAAAATTHRRRRAVTWAAAVTWARFRSLRTAAKGGVLAMVAVLSVTSAAAANVLPAAVQETVGVAVETVTPWEIPRPDRGGIGKLVREKARQHGQDKDKDKDDKKIKDNNGVGTPPPSPGRPPSPGKSGMAPKSDAPQSQPPKSQAPKATHPPKPSHPAKPTVAATPSPPGASKAAKPTASPAAGRPSEPGAAGRSKAAERQSLKEESKTK